MIVAWNDVNGDDDDDDDDFPPEDVVYWGLSC